MTCARCQHVSDPDVLIGNLTICPACGATLVIDEVGETRPARAADVEGLSFAARVTLTQARAASGRPTRRRR